MQHTSEYTKTFTKNTIKVLTMSWDGPNHKREDLFRIHVCGQHIHGKKKNSLKTSARKKNSEGKEPTEINIPGPIEHKNCRRVTVQILVSAFNFLGQQVAQFSHT